MCLVIDTFKHDLNSQGYYEPKTTILPKKVYKILYIEPACKNTCCTPYQNVIIHFKNGKAILKELAMLSYYRRGWDIAIIEIGIHAFEKKITAQFFLKLWSHADTKFNLTIYEAIIPVGTKYFYGTKDMIVSEKLIIKNKIVK